MDSVTWVWNDTAEQAAGVSHAIEGEGDFATFFTGPGIGSDTLPVPNSFTFTFDQPFFGVDTFAISYHDHNFPDTMKGVITVQAAFCGLVSCSANGDTGAICYGNGGNPNCTCSPGFTYEPNQVTCRECFSLLQLLLGMAAFAVLPPCLSSCGITHPNSPINCCQGLKADGTPKRNGGDLQATCTNDNTTSPGGAVFDKAN
eukprot:SM002313S08032  [mRNA]  locus=s2313:165:1375:+ [translate_table: standard]